MFRSVYLVALYKRNPNETLTKAWCRRLASSDKLTQGFR